MRQEYRKVVEHNELEVIVVPGDERIRAMPFSEKLKIALEYADWEGAAYKARDMAVLFAACSVILGVIALTPLDEVIIVLAPVLELIGYGGAAIEFAKAVYKLADFVDRVRNAQSEGALAEAGSVFAEAAAAIGITMLFAFLGKLSKMTKERFRNRHTNPDVKWTRENTVGRNPGKNSRTGREVIARMELENKIKIDKETGVQLVYSEHNKLWYPIDECDMAHIVDAVTWWNEIGRDYGALSPDVRRWMLESKNYYLEYYRVNRVEGGMSLERYLAPKK